MAAVSDSELSTLFKAVQQHDKARRFPDAFVRLSLLIDHVDAPGDAYERWVQKLLDLAEDPRVLGSLPTGAGQKSAALGLVRAAFYARLYLGRPEDLDRLRSDRRIVEQLPVESALFLAALPLAAGPPEKSPARQAAQLFAAQGRPVRAAAAWLRARDHAAAIHCYEQLLSSRPAPGREPLGPYEQALVHYQLAVALSIDYDAQEDVVVYRGRDNAAAIHRHAVAAQGILEQLADDFEAQGQPERAIDAYCILIALGRVLGRFEHIAEGFVGCLRLLKAERLITAALHAYEDFLACCTGPAREHALAGQQAREAAEFLDGCGLPWGDHYRARAAGYFEQAAEDPRSDAPRRESLLLQALSLWNSLDAQRRAQAVLARLLAQASEPGAARGSPTREDATRRRQRYQRLAHDYEQALGPLPTAPEPPSASEPAPAPADAIAGEPPPEPPPGLGDRSGELPVWDLDLREWEDAGDPALIATALLCDRDRPLLCRRHALRIGLLYALAPTWTEGESPTQARLRLVDALTGLRTYEALRPLERLYQAASLPGPFPPPPRVDPTIPAAAQAAGDPSDPTVARAILLVPLPATPDPGRLARTTDDLLSPPARTELRRQIIQGLSRLPYRRALQLALRGLHDPEVSVFAAGLDALAQGRYIGSTSLLSRLVQGERPTSPAGSPSPAAAAASTADVRRVALIALGRTRDLRAYGVLLDVYRSEPEPLRSEAFHLLRYALRSDANTVRPLLLRALAHPTPDTQALRTLVSD